MVYFVKAQAGTKNLGKKGIEDKSIRRDDVSNKGKDRKK